MKKLLCIIVVSLLSSTSANAVVLSWQCSGGDNFKYMNWQLDLDKKELNSQYVEKNKSKQSEQFAKVVQVGNNSVNVRVYKNKQKTKTYSMAWEFNYNTKNIYVLQGNKKYYYGDCKPLHDTKIVSKNNTQTNKKKPIGCQCDKLPYKL